MTNKLPAVHFGTVKSKRVDWRKEPFDDRDDDGERDTPHDVIKMLGFDPKKEHVNHPKVPVRHKFEHNK
jgi:hypothetical protein